MEEYIYFHKVEPFMLDGFLKNGWYRQGLNMFTTDKVMVNDKELDVYWLRYNLKAIEKSNLLNTKLKDWGNRFTYSITNFEITDDINYLYRLYRNSLDFEISDTIEDLLFTTNYPVATRTVFDTKSVNVFYINQLVALGVFDKGSNAIAGIVNIFHPEFKKHSLGKYLIYLKLQYALLNNHQFYYPGYVVAGYKKFDYKLSILKEANEIFVNNNWYAYPKLSVNETLSVVDFI